jgi:hypothetical protein
MRCPNCGAQIGSFQGDTYTCEYCRSTYHAREFDPDWGKSRTDGTGTQEAPVVKEIHHYHHEEAPDRLSAGLGCLIFLFFPLGWIIFFLYRDSSPRKARTAMVIAAVMTLFFLAGVLNQP